MPDLSYLTIQKAHELLQKREISTVELVNFYLQRIELLDKKLRLNLYVNKQNALERAAAVDKKISAGETIHLLEGIPYTAKDMFLTQDVPTTAASHILENFEPPFSATAIAKLDEVGAILLAKVNHDEFGHGASTENSGFHPSHNPWDLERVPGGSSGGGAAAVAADIGLFSMATDTGGSSRQPASFCGVVGLKPTYGLVSRYGVVAMASSLDCVSPIARTVEDAAQVLATIAGKDVNDATTITSNALTAKQSVKAENVKIGVVDEYLEGLDSENLAVITQAIDDLQQTGVTIEHTSLQSLKFALPTYYVITPSEISSNLSRYDGIRYGYSDGRATNLAETYMFSRGHGFGEEVKRRIMIGSYALSAGYYDAYYKKAMQVRTLIIQDFEKAFSQFDVLIGPTTPSTAFRFGENTDDPVQMYLADIMTVAANLAGIPSISVPSGAINNLPTGLQLMAAQKNEDTLLSVATIYQNQTNWHTVRPAL